jgi:hypothetical protein
MAAVRDDPLGGRRSAREPPRFAAGSPSTLAPTSPSGVVPHREHTQPFAWGLRGSNDPRRLGGRPVAPEPGR